MPKIFLTSLKIIITIAIFYYFFKKYDLAHIYNSYDTSDFLASLFLCATLLLIQGLICSIRLKKIGAILNEKFNLKAAWEASSIGGFYSHTPLSFIGGDIVRIATLSGKKRSLKKLTGVVMLDRITGLMGLALLCILLLPILLLKWGGGITNIKNISYIFLGYSIGLLMLFCLLHFANFLIKRYNLVIQRSFDLTSSQFQMVKNNLLKLLLLSLAAYVLATLGFIFIDLTLQLKINPLILAISIPYAIVVTLIPISIAGWGLREGAVIFVLNKLGTVPTETCLILSITYGLAVFLAFIPGSLIYFWNKKNGI